MWLRLLFCKKRNVIVASQSWLPGQTLTSVGGGGNLTGLIAELLRLESDVAENNRGVWISLISCNITAKVVTFLKKHSFYLGLKKNKL